MDNRVHGLLGEDIALFRWNPAWLPREESLSLTANGTIVVFG